MNRVLEPELITDAEQALAHAAADFASVNQAFVDRFCRLFPDAQLETAGLGGLRCEMASDRRWAAWGPNASVRSIAIPIGTT